eukprot:Pgem_evm1s16640
MNLKVLCTLIFGILCVNSTPIREKAPNDFIKAPASSKFLPIVIWHGLGGHASSLNHLIADIKLYADDQLLEYEVASSINIYSIEIGKTPEEQVRNSRFMDANKQVELACEQLRQNKDLENGFIAIGVSQGGNFFRGVVESPHQGIARVPNFPEDSWESNYVAMGVNRAMLSEVMQHKLTPAGYWHGLNEKAYLEGNVFLTDINNAKTEKNPLYKKNLLKLNKFAMIKMTYDEVVDPPESSFFGYYDPKNPNKIQKLPDTTLYKEDHLGLKQLNHEGRLVFIEFEGSHLELLENEENQLLLIESLSEELFLKKLVSYL